LKNQYFYLFLKPNITCIYLDTCNIAYTFWKYLLGIYLALNIIYRIILCSSTKTQAASTVFVQCTTVACGRQRGLPDKKVFEDPSAII
jgi:hypothetical protein